MKIALKALFIGTLLFPMGVWAEETETNEDGLTEAEEPKEGEELEGSEDNEEPEEPEEPKEPEEDKGHWEGDYWLENGVRCGTVDDDLCVRGGGMTILHVAGKSMTQNQTHGIGLTYA